jgi:uncharacterized protein (TIGR03437 family)
MKNVILTAGLVFGSSVLAPPFRAQSSCVTRVTTSPEGVTIYVDGQGYTSGGTFNWTTGSKHTLAAEPISGTFSGIRYLFSGWTAGSNSLGSDTTVVVTADPLLPVFTAAFTKQYLVTVNAAGCGESTSCSLPGTVLVGGTAITGTTQIWVAAGTSLTLQATPNDGFVFTGWSAGGATIQGYLATVTVTAPMSITPSFQVARTVNLATVPDGLKVIADHNVMTAPAAIAWGRATVHSLSAVSPQLDRYGKYWVFNSWSDGLAMTHTYTVADTLAADTVTATFAPAARVTLLTVPTGLKLSVDGKTTWSSYYFTWGVGETHRVEAPAQQTDAQGRTWVFQSWSDNSPAAFDLTVPSSATDGGLRASAIYGELGRITVTSNQSSAKVTVDGSSCATPCTIDRAAGVQVKISAPASISLGDGMRADFVSWSDGSTGDLDVTAALEAKTVTATYKVMYLLSVTADPVESATFRTSPTSADSYFESGTSVTVSAIANGGYKFKRWDGDLTSNVNVGTLVLSAARAVRATFTKVPYIAPAGVANGAGTGTAEGVAPGSVIAISGANLAGALVTGPENPLAQTLGDVIVLIGDRMLPLFFVSPEQISAQLPADVDLGTTTLTARWASQAAVQAEFQVVRNAPGLLQDVVDTQSFAVATHSDGKVVSVTSPARRGEKLTIFGSGFGPTEPQRPMGFAVPSDPVYVLTDTPSLRIGESTIAVEAAYAAAGRVGVDAVEFYVPDSAVSGTAKVVLIVGGQESNTVLIPVE